MIEIVNDVHHVPLTTYVVDIHNRVVRRDLYPHKAVKTVVHQATNSFQAWQLAFKMEAQARSHRIGYAHAQPV